MADYKDDDEEEFVFTVRDCYLAKWLGFLSGDIKTSKAVTEIRP